MVAVPQDLVAIFHSSFHATQGNIIDWNITAPSIPSLDFTNLEYSVLPSGLHLVERDVVYFATSENYPGLAIFRRRKSAEQGQRGFRLSSLGIILQKPVEGERARPWLHLEALQALADTFPAEPEDVRPFFSQRSITEPRWENDSDELDSPSTTIAAMLHTLGPSSITLYKHILSRKRVLIYTQPPVQVAGEWCRVAADMCFEQQRERPVLVLGMVTLNDIPRMKEDSDGWVACTTDALFLERPMYYDLLIDLTATTATAASPQLLTPKPTSTARPAMYLSRPIPGLKSQWRLQLVRFAWSDVKLWNQLHQVIHPSSPQPLGILPLSSMLSWTDPWRAYEEVCLICAGLWMGNTAGTIRLDGEDEAMTKKKSKRASSSSSKKQPRNTAGMSSSSTTTDLTKELFRILHTATSSQLRVLSTLLDSNPGSSALMLTPKEMVSLDLGAFSSYDVKYLESLIQAECAQKRTVCVRRAFRDYFGVVFGYG